MKTRGDKEKQKREMKREKEKEKEKRGLGEDAYFDFNQRVTMQY